MNARKSLILITVDCLRADHCGFAGYPQATTPFLDRLAQESFVFPKAIAVGVPTYYSFPGIMASRFPLALGREVVGIAPGEPTLASVLRSAGYRTAAYVAGNPYLASRSAYSQGFEVFRDHLFDETPRTSAQTTATVTAHGRLTALNLQIAEAAHRSRPLGKLYDALYFQYRLKFAAPKAQSFDRLRCFPPANVLVDEACEWLGSVGHQPFFLWIHFMDPHAPYYPVEEALSAMGEHISPDRGRYLNAAWVEMSAKAIRRYRAEIVRLHDAGIRWVDTQVERLVETLRRQSLRDSSVLALTADHGEEFLDHGGRLHFSSSAYQEMLQVPLLMRVPGARKVALSDAPFSQLHLAPTVLDAIGVSAPKEFQGRSYWSEMQHGGNWDHALSESIGSCTNPADASRRIGGRVLVVLDQRYKLVLDFDHHREELFDLVSDPRELHALPIDAYKPERARLLAILLRHVSSNVREANREMTLRARLHEIGLEWKHSKMDSKTLAS
ncbi:MAG: sulfatase [Acidobacteria bacterium]|nr:sulfatase [Acidobacteriota bacterium]